MSNADTWMILKDVARRKSDASAQRFGTLIGKRTEAQQKLQLLLDYRQDYRERLARATRSGIRGEGLRNYQSFLDHLERAIEAQSGVVTDIAHAVAHAKGQWAGDQRKVDSYQVLEDRRESKESSKKERAQQALQDDFAARAFARSTPTAPTGNR